MTQLEYRDYMHSLAVNLKDIANNPDKNDRFFEIVQSKDEVTGAWDEDFENALKSRINITGGKCVMVLEAMHEKFQGSQQARNVKSVPYGCFMLLKKAVTGKSNYTARQVSQSIAESGTAAKKVLCWIEADTAKRYNGGGDIRTAMLIDWNELVISPIGPIVDGMVGVRVDFTFMTPSSKPFVYDLNDWTIPL